MADSTNVPGAICIQGGQGLRATLRPEWRPLLDQVCKDLQLTRTAALRRAIKAYPEANMAEALRLLIAGHFAGANPAAPSDDVVVDLQCITRLDIPPDRVLQRAMGVLQTAVLVGYTKSGEEFFASSVADGADAVWHLQRASLRLLSMPDRS